MSNPIIHPSKNILYHNPSENIPFFGFLGFLFMIYFSAGSIPSPIAGNESVTKLIQSRWIARRGVSKPKSSPKNIVIISPILVEIKKWTA